MVYAPTWLHAIESDLPICKSGGEKKTTTIASVYTFATHEAKKQLKYWKIQLMLTMREIFETERLTILQTEREGVVEYLNKMCVCAAVVIGIRCCRDVVPWCMFEQNMHLRMEKRKKKLLQTERPDDANSRVECRR